MDIARIKIAWEARRLERHRLDARRREGSALQRAGADLFQRLRAEAGSELDRLEESARRTFDALHEIDQRITSLSAALERSLETDRTDFASASPFGRWLVIARGILERIVLRDRMRADRRARSKLEHDLAALALDGAVAQLRACLTESAIAEVQAARDDQDSASATRAKLLEPYAGEPLPPMPRALLREMRTFFDYAWAQLSSKIFLRAPAVAGLIAGWWIAHTYTDSALEGLGYELGFGGRRAISAGTMSWLNILVPLFAAALFAYLAAFVAARVQRRYAPRSGQEGGVSRDAD